VFQQTAQGIGSDKVRAIPALQSAALTVDACPLQRRQRPRIALAKNNGAISPKFALTKNNGAIFRRCFHSPKTSRNWG
jgi:hypothetical protein